MSGEPSSGCAPLTPPIAALQPSHRASWCVQRIGETCSWCAAPWAVLLADCRLRAGTSTACLVGKVRGQQELCVRNESLVGQFLWLAQSGRRCLMSDVSNVDGTLTCWDSNLLPPFRPRRLEDREWEQVAQPQFTRVSNSPHAATTSTSSRVAAPCVEVHDMKSCTNVNQGKVVQSLYCAAQQPSLQACSKVILPGNSNYCTCFSPASHFPLRGTRCLRQIVRHHQGF